MMYSFEYNYSLTVSPADLVAPRTYDDQYVPLHPFNLAVPGVYSDTNKDLGHSDPTPSRPPVLRFWESLASPISSSSESTTSTTASVTGDEATTEYSESASTAAFGLDDTQMKLESFSPTWMDELFGGDCFQGNSVPSLHRTESGFNNAFLDTSVLSTYSPSLESFYTLGHITRPRSLANSPELASHSDVSSCFPQHYARPRKATLDKDEYLPSSGGSSSGEDEECHISLGPIHTRLWDALDHNRPNRSAHRTSKRRAAPTDGTQAGSLPGMSLNYPVPIIPPKSTQYSKHEAVEPESSRVGSSKEMSLLMPPNNVTAAPVLSPAHLSVRPPKRKHQAEEDEPSPDNNTQLSLSHAHCLSQRTTGINKRPRITEDLNPSLLTQEQVQYYQSHARDFNLECPLCMTPYTFKRPVELGRHFGCHGPRLEICEVNLGGCGNGFTRSDALKRHLKTCRALKQARGEQFHGSH
ncbi:hypothetical protein H0H87_000808 [Tephrocybe sp. NHM501043]|nr:hypothetical protein H0H87_000808 [Tephrocybe sp. NHM501043]